MRKKIEISPESITKKIIFVIVKVNSIALRIKEPY